MIRGQHRNSQSPPKCMKKHMFELCFCSVGIFMMKIYLLILTNKMHDIQHYVNA